MNRNVFYRIILLFLIPALGVMYYSAIYIFDKYDSVNQIKRTSQVITFLRQSEKMVNNIQLERGISSLYIGSKNQNFLVKLNEQQNKTDKSYLEFKKFIDEFQIKNQKIKDIVTSIILKIDNINILRDKVFTQSGDILKILDEYTNINKDIIDSIEYFYNMKNHHEVSIEFDYLLNIIKIKEQVGIERGLLSKIFLTKKINNQDEYLSVIHSIATQKAYTEDFLLSSNEELLKIYNKYISSLQSDINYYRQIVLKSNQQEFFNIEPMKWWEISSIRENNYSLLTQDLISLFIKDIDEITSDSKQKLYISLFIWLTGFIALIIGHNLLNKLVLAEEQNYTQLEQQKYIYNMLAHTNELVIHDYLQEQVYREICAIAVKQSNLSLAYIGLVDENGDIEVVASDGKASSYVQKLSLTSNPEHKEKQLGIAGKAIYEDKNIIINDILKEKSSPLCALAYEYRLRSAGVYPLRKFNKIVGVMVFYAKEINFFNQDIDLLFDRIATNISFGIEKIYYETIRKDDEQKLIYKAQHDSLTDLPNRTLFMDRLEYSIKVKSRTKIKGAVVFIDLDNFKPVNDNFGHHIGDLVLIKVAKILLSETRAEDTVARLGGDEFVVLIDSLDGQTHEENEELLVAIGTKIRKSIEEPIVSDDSVVNISASIGIVVFPDGFHNPNEIVKFADEAMYESKNSGKNQIRFYQK